MKKTLIGSDEPVNLGYNHYSYVKLNSLYCQIMSNLTVA